MRLVPAALVALSLLTPSVCSAALGDCGQPVSTGPAPTVTDSLSILRAAIGAGSCDLSVCDVDGTCAITASDALRLLSFVTGSNVEINCNGACGQTTTSTTSTTLAPAATWTQAIAVFASNSCSAIGCHNSQGFASGGLGGLDDFDIGYDELVGAAVECVGGTFTARVVPGNPEGSFLLDKLEITPECGSPMPSGVQFGTLPPVSPADKQLLRSWILSGAPKN